MWNRLTFPCLAGAAALFLGGAARAAVPLDAHAPSTVCTLTNTAQFRALTIPQAIQGWPLSLEGVITLVDSNRSLLVLQDDTGALAVRFDPQSAGFRPGQQIRLETSKAVPIVATFPEFPGQPSGSNWLPTFSAPTNWGTAYLARMHGFLTPPTSGLYTFWLTSKRASELWLSTNAEPGGIGKLAFVDSEAGILPGRWSKFPSQRSCPVYLEAGQRYLIDVIHEHHSGRDDHLSVAWQGPGFERAVIDGRFLSPSLDGHINGIVREYWNDYFVAAVEPLTSKGICTTVIRVTQPRVQVLGAGSFPEPMQLNAGSAASAADNYRWVEAEGVVAFATVNHGVLALELANGPKRTSAQILGWGEDSPTWLEGCRVRVRGVCENLLDSDGNATVAMIRAPSPREVTELAPDAGDLLALKAVPIAELNPANPNLAWNRRIRVRGTVAQQQTNRLLLMNSGSFCGYLSSSGSDWKPIGPPVEIEMSNAAFAGLAVSSFSVDSLATAAFDSVTGVTSSSQSFDVFSPAQKGRTRQEGETYIVQGGGVGIGSSYDQFRYCCDRLIGEGEIVARVTSLEDKNSQAIAGIMIRTSLSSRCGEVCLGLKQGGKAVFIFRQGFGEHAASISLPDFNAPCWLRLTRRYARVWVQVDQPLPALVGQPVDLVGSLGWENGQAVLSHARNLASSEARKAPSHPEPAVGAPDPSSEPPTIPIGQLLPYEDGSLKEGSGLVHVRGVVTFSGQAFGAPYLLVQDHSAGCLVRLNNRLARRPLAVGALVEFGLRTVNGKWPVPLDPSSINVLGTGPLPAPAPQPAAYSPLRLGEGRWDEIDGIVRTVGKDGVLELRRKDGVMTVWIGEASVETLRGYVDALVRLRGALVRTAEGNRALLAPSPAFVEVSEPPLADPFAVPAINIADLHNFSRPSAALHRVRVRGVVTYHNADLLLLQDPSGGVRVHTAQAAQVRIGNLLDAVGFPETQTGFVSLAEGLVRVSRTVPLPQPTEPSPADLEAGKHDACLVRLTAQLLEQRLLGNNQILELQAGPRLFDASLAVRSPRLPAIPIGSKVEITGVCQIMRSEEDSRLPELNQPRVRSIEVLLRSPADVVVRQLPPWWAWKHAAAMIGGLMVILALALVWIRLLQHQVRQRTRQLETTMAKLERETGTSATLAERNRLAGELHDGLEQGLSGIMMQLDGLESRLADSPTDAARHLRLARNMVRYSRTEIRHSLWEWKSPALAEKGLGAALSDIAGQMSAGCQTRVTVEVSGSPLPLPQTTEHHLLRISQEALTNALKYADASTIRIHLDYSSHCVRLGVQDDGRGFDPETVLNVSAGHFGLQSLRSRARKLGGRLTITSAPERGSTIEVTVPLNGAAPAHSNPGA